MCSTVCPNTSQFGKELQHNFYEKRKTFKALCTCADCLFPSWLVCTPLSWALPQPHILQLHLHTFQCGSCTRYCTQYTSWGLPSLASQPAQQPCPSWASPDSHTCSTLPLETAAFLVNPHLPCKAQYECHLLQGAPHRSSGSLPTTAPL